MESEKANNNIQLPVQEDRKNLDKYYHQKLCDEPKIDHQPWPQPKKPRRSRRQSVLAEELMALGVNKSGKDNEQGTKSKASRHWSLLAKELKQARLKHEEEEQVKAETETDECDGEDQDEESKQSITSIQNTSKEGTSGSTNSGNRASSSTPEGLPSQASQALAKSNKLEDQINLQHLVELMRIFHEADENGSDGLDIDEFRAAFGQILGKGKNDQQMAIMFMKIDTNCDGTVDWDEFCTYMLLEYQEKEVMAGERLPPFPYPLRILSSPTHEMVTKITYLPSLQRHAHTNSSNSDGAESSDHHNSGNSTDGRFVTVCKDGTLCFWKSDLTLQRSMTVDSGKPKLTWVTDLVMLPNVNKMILSFTDNMLALYDLAAANYDCQCQIVGLPACVLHMHYWFDPNRYNRAVLVMGDTAGGVITLEFTKVTMHLFGPSTNHHESQRITFSELLHYKQDGLKVLYMPKVHSDWVCQVKYCSSMSYIMSSSNDCNCSLNLADLHGRKESSVLRVRKGVTSFDYCKEWNIIGTGGIDRIVRYWNPYVTGEPIAVLKGHSSAVMHVAINSTQGHVLSLSKDLELRVWSIQHQLCVQSCHRVQTLLPNSPTAFYLHPHTGNVFIGTNHIAALESSQHDEQVAGVVRGEIVSHEKQLCAALYNENFNQVVSGCHGSVVSVWDVDTGEKTIQFSHCHGSMEITAMAFDPTGRRLITGGRDGSIKIWNFNNGACLSVLESRFNEEVSCVSFMKQRIVVGGWSRCLAVYGDTRDPDDVIPKYWAVGAHKEDILCMAFQEPNTLASASYDGDIVVWNLDVERPICRFNDSKPNRKTRASVALSCSDIPVCGGRHRNEEFRIKEQHSVEKILFLKSRDQSDQSTATLISCGTGGWVQLWNHSGGGLIGKFNIWDNSRHTIPEECRNLECITTMTLSSKDAVLITGNSLGYVQMWNIAKHCMDIPDEERPVITSPQYTTVWRAHLLSIVSIDLAEDKGLLITASTDCSVRMWTNQGRYIGTFGEKSLWNLSYPIRPINLPRKIPPGINRAVSYKTLHTISGPCNSKWKLARNLFRLLRQSKRRQEAMKLFGIGKQGVDGVGDTAHILGKCYERKTRFREPIATKNIPKADGRLVGIYNTLHCADVMSVEQCQASNDLQQREKRIQLESQEVDIEENSETLKPIKAHTEQTLLHTPNRKVTIYR